MGNGRVLLAQSVLSPMQNKTLNQNEVEQIIARFSAYDRYKIVERLGIMYEDRPVTKQQLNEVIADELKILPHE